MKKRFPACEHYRVKKNVVIYSSGSLLKVFEARRRGVHHWRDLNCFAEFLVRSCRRIDYESAKFPQLGTIAQMNHIQISIVQNFERYFANFHNLRQSNASIDVNIRSPKLEHPNHVRWNLVTSKIERMNISNG